MYILIIYFILFYASKTKINFTCDSLLISLQTLNYSSYLKEWALIVRYAQVLFITIHTNYK